MYYNRFVVDQMAEGTPIPVMEDTSNDIGEQFEEETREFLRKVGFNHVKGGRTFNIAPEGKSNQIDACGLIGNALVVIECTAAGRHISRDEDAKISQASDKFKVVLDNYKRVPEYKDCTYFRFVFATKNIDLKERNFEKLKDKRIYHLDAQTIWYYSDLFLKIGKYAGYNFLADIKLRPTKADSFKTNAYVVEFHLKREKVNAYLFYADPKELLKFAYVARRWRGDEEFYQRGIEASRLDSIKDFIEAGGIFPTNIVISIRRPFNFTPYNKKRSNNIQDGFLEIENYYDSCWIIDGQHRLYSFANANSGNFMVPCIAFGGASPATERSFFLKINEEQRPVQPDLIWDLRGQIDKECETREGLISNLVRMLDYDTRSIFYNTVYIPLKGTKEGKSINMAAFCNGIKNSGITSINLPNSVGGDNYLVEDQGRRKGRLFISFTNYFKGISDLVSDPSLDYLREFLFGNAGVPILLYLFEPIVSHKLKRKIGVPTYGELRPYSEIIIGYLRDNYDQQRLREKRSETASEGGRKLFAKEIGRKIREILKDSNFWPNMETVELEDQAKKVEKLLRDLIKQKLSGNEAHDWLKEVPSDVVDKAKKSQKSEGRGIPLEEYFGAGEEYKIIEHKWNLFEKVFIGRRRFHTTDDLKQGFYYLGLVRNPEVHNRQPASDYTDIRIIESYIDKLQNSLDEAGIEIDD